MGLVRYWRNTDGSPGEYKHFKSLLPLSAVIYSQQTVRSPGNTIFSELSRARGPAALLGPRGTEEDREGRCQWLDRSRDNISPRSIDHYVEATSSLSQSSRGLKTESWPKGNRTGESWDLQDGEVYHAKSGTCAAAWTRIG